MAVRSVQEKLQELLDKEEIFALSSTYMRGLDRLEPDLVRSVYHDDATDDRGFFQGGPDAFVQFAMQALAGHKANHHMLGQASIDVEGDVAFGDIYFQAYNWKCTRLNSNHVKISYAVFSLNKTPVTVKP